MTLKLCGFSASNYYNKVKLQLLEKGVPFEEELVWTGLKNNPALSERSPLGKVPFIETPQGVILESSPCCEYIEDAYPANPLIPADPFAAAQVRHLIVYLDLHLELVARQLYGPIFFGAPAFAQERYDATRKHLMTNLAAFAKIAKFAPYVAGDTFTLADCAAIVHLPIIASLIKIIYKEDMYADYPQITAYLDAMKNRPTVQKVNADRKDSTAALMAKIANMSKKS